MEQIKIVTIFADMIIEIKNKDHHRLQKIWESAVINTHHFLKEEDFFYYKKHLSSYLNNILLYGYEINGDLFGFIGVDEGNIEMLFIHNDHRGHGIGKSLVHYAIENLQASKVDVNEQNTQAVEFYEYIGFKVISRSELDSDGKNYPILHMELV